MLPYLVRFIKIKTFDHHTFRRVFSQLCFGQTMQRFIHTILLTTRMGFAPKSSAYIPKRLKIPFEFGAR